MTRGKIYPEWWVHCLACGEAAPTAETDRSKATAGAKLLGYRSVKGAWYCGACARQRAVTAAALPPRATVSRRSR